MTNKETPGEKIGQQERAENKSGTRITEKGKEREEDKKAYPSKANADRLLLCHEEANPEVADPVDATTSIGVMT